MSKLLLTVTAIIAFLVQALNPLWWFTVATSFYYFWVEGVLEGAKLNFFGEYEGNLLWGLFSVYSIMALIAVIWSFFSLHKINAEHTYTTRDIIFLIINVTTIFLAIMHAILNGGRPMM